MENASSAVSKPIRFFLPNVSRSLFSIFLTNIVHDDPFSMLLDFLFYSRIYVFGLTNERMNGRPQVVLNSPARDRGDRRLRAPAPLQQRRDLAPQALVRREQLGDARGVVGGALLHLGAAMRTPQSAEIVGNFLTKN